MSSWRLSQAPLTRRVFLTNCLVTALALPGRALFAQDASASAVVHTPLGMLRGQQERSVRVFRGIPFAQPPVGALRFRPPARTEPWSAERDAVNFSAAAMQPGDTRVPKSEDCLYLNVWAPDGPGPFPVFVWVHGGGFTGGRSFDPLFDGTRFAQEGIICITVAYRLGVFGFLDLEPLLGTDFAGSANNGLRDVIAALGWVQSNVAAFGGDPARVTIGGESAGAKLTDILMGVPSARPLFSQVISESGGAERVLPASAAAAVAAGFADQWRSLGNHPGMIQTASASALIAAQDQFLAQWPQHFPLRPEVDGVLLPRLPVQTVAAGSTRGKRLLIGTNRDESALFIGPHPSHDPTAADIGNLTPAEFAQVASRYGALYPQMTDEQRRIRSLTAEEYWVPSVRLADAHVQAGGRAWMYELDFTQTSGRLARYAYHSLDLALVWDKPHVDVANAQAEAALAEKMHQAWVAFIKGGTPAAAGLPVWPNYRTVERPTMIFDVQSQVEQQPQEAELRLWDGYL